MTPADSASTSPIPRASRRASGDPVGQAPRTAGERRARLFARRRLRTDRAADPAAGRDLPRHVGRGNPRPALSDQRRRRRRAVPAGPTTRSRSAAPISPPTRPGGIAEYSYLGPVFRARAGQGGELTQTGLESFGRRDAEAADAEIFSLAMEAAAAAGGGQRSRCGSATPGCSTRVLDC